MNSWVSNLPPWLKTLFYSFESAFIVALILPLTQIYGALQSPAGFNGFSWQTIWHDFYICLATGLVKALIDYLKNLTTSSPASTAAQNGKT